MHMRWGHIAVFGTASKPDSHQNVPISIYTEYSYASVGSTSHVLKSLLLKQNFRRPNPSLPPSFVLSSTAFVFVYVALLFVQLIYSIAGNINKQVRTR